MVTMVTFPPSFVVQVPSLVGLGPLAAEHVFFVLFDLMTYLICKLGDLIFKLGDGHYSMTFSPQYGAYHTKIWWP